MIEEIVLEHLEERMDRPVYMEIPERNMPAEFILIEKTGSMNENFLITSTLAIQSISASMYGAAKLNERMIDAMKSLIENDLVTRCKLDSDYNFTDQEKKQYRYQAVFDITHY